MSLNLTSADQGAHTYVARGQSHTPIHDLCRTSRLLNHLQRSGTQLDIMAGDSTVGVEGNTSDSVDDNDATIVTYCRYGATSMAYFYAHTGVKYIDEFNALFFTHVL